MWTNCSHICCLCRGVVCPLVRWPTIERSGDQDRAQLPAFEAVTFPEWLRSFECGDSSVLVARDSEGQVLGSLLFRGPGPVSVFAPVLGPMARTISWVGVASQAQDGGVGQCDGRPGVGAAPRRRHPHVPHRLGRPASLLRSAGLRTLAAPSGVPAPVTRAAGGQHTEARDRRPHVSS
jgi:hypothetical protein